MKSLVPATVLTIVLGILSSSVCARVAVNEVLANEPAGFTGLEWFELYNNSDQNADLNFYQFTVGASQFSLNVVMSPHGFLVVCRKLVGTPVNPGFETHWGDNSGVWGDAISENYPVVEAAFSLTNASGSVVVSILGITESSLGWTVAGLDGVSWERDRPSLDLISQCQSPYGSTPGKVNSRTPVALDLALDSVMVSPSSGGAAVTLVISSRSLNVFTGGEITLFYLDPADTLRSDSQVVVIALPSIDTGVTTVVNQQIQLGGVYRRLGAVLGHDDRDENNRRMFVATGSAFPPIELSEVLANPQGNLHAEWIELRSREDSSVSLSGWRVGDSTRLSPAESEPTTIVSRGYLVMTEDTADFRSFYLGFTGILSLVSPWPMLNNTGDQVRLVDSFGFTADSFSYSEVFDSNQTWGKTEGSQNRWGRSVVDGGTPGIANDVRFAPAGRALSVTITPQIISPDGDGIDDTALIAVEAPQAKGFTLRIYDVRGRLVKTFEHNAIDLAIQYVWYGRDDGGGRLPVGIYILYAEAAGVESIRKTIVVAR